LSSKVIRVLNYRPRIAVLLAAYNGMAFIEQQLQTILQQKGVKVAVYISVDLSSDGIFQWCQKLAQSHPEVTVLPYGERFGGAASNFYRLIRDVDFSAFDYIALSDQDDIWLPDKLISACQSIDKHGVDAYSSNVLAFWPDGHEQLIDKAQPQRQYDYLFESAGPGCTYVMKTKPLMAFKTALISDWEQANQVTLHDWFLYAFFRTNDYQWIIDSEYKMRYRQHEHNQVGVNKGFNARIKRLRLLRNGWYKQQVLLIAQLVDTDNSLFTSRWHILKKITQLRRDWKDRLVLCACVLMGLFK